LLVIYKTLQFSVYINLQYIQPVSYWGKYLNFSIQFMKNVWNAQQFAENKTEILQHVLKML